MISNHSAGTLQSKHCYWAVPYGESEVNTMLNQAKDVMAWNDGMTDQISRWYMHVLL